MSSLLDHLDNNCSDRDEDDHINRLFPKCKPRASSLQPFATSANDEDLSIESKVSLSDCNLTNSNNNINTVNNNLSQSQPENRRDVSNVFNNDLSKEREYDNFSFRCLNGPVKVSCENSNNRLPVSSSSSKSKGKSDNRHSRNRRRQHHSNTEFVSREKNSIQLNTSAVTSNQASSGKRSSTSHRRIMECDTLDDHFDNGIESGGSGGSGSNGSAFSHCSSLGSSGEKNNALSVSSSGLGSSGGNIGLRDSRIEIAGGREIFSHSRIKVGRRVRGSSSMDSMIVQQGMESSGAMASLTPSSSQSQLQAKVRRKSTNNTTANPQITHSSPISSCNSIWEPHHIASNKKSFPFSSSSSSSSRGERERDRGTNFGDDVNTSSKGISRHSHGQSGVHCSHGRSNRSSHSQSQYYGRHGYSEGKKTLSLDGFDVVGNKSIMPQVHSPSSVVTSPSSGLMMKETVFSSEITSIEKPVEAPKEVKQPFIYQTPIDGGGEIVFDDIEDHWRGRGGESDDKEATFVSMGSVDKSQLNFLETLMRENEDEQQQQHPVETHEVASVSAPLGSSPSNPSGYESDECASSSIPANNSKTSPNNGNKRLIGNIPIAEYEGSPKRYGLRLPTQAKPNHLELVDPNSPTVAHSHLNVSTRGLSPRLQSPSSSSFQGARVPGFPLRVDTTSVPVAVKTLVNEDFSSETSINSMHKESQDYKLESDGQLNSKLDGIMSPVSGSLPVMSSVSQSLTATNTGTITGTTTSGTADTSPDDSVVSQQGSNNTTTNSSEDPEIELSSHRTDLTEDREDYLLYEFSETRKVLDEFFKPATGGDERLGNFDELDYTLRRQTGNSYVGQRLAGESCNEQVEESPKKPPRRGVLLNVSSGGGASPRLISFQEVSLPLSHNSHLQSSISPSSSMMTPNAAMLLDSSRDVNDNDIDVETASTNTETDLGDTEVGLQVGHSRNFTLSPETTDCDSNELESEISLDYEASLHSSSRIGATMPVLEDGLSSGNVSDNEDPDEDDCHELKRNTLTSRKSSNQKNISSAVTHVSTTSEPNPTLLLMKKQISEIEKEIKLRSQKVQHSDTNGSGGANGTGSPSSSLPDSSPGTVNPPSSNSTGKTFIGINNVDENFALRDARPESSIFDCNDPELEALDPMRPTPPPSPAPSSVPHHLPHSLHHLTSSQQPSHSQILPGRVVSFTSCSNEGLNICPSTNSTTLTTSTSNSLSSSLNVNNGCITTSSGGGATNSSLGLGNDSSNVIISSESSSGGVSSTGDIQNIKDAVQLPKNLPSQRSTFDTSTSSPPSTVTTTVTTTNSVVGTSSSQPSQQSSSEERLVPLIRDSSPVWVPRHPASTGGNHHPHRSVNAGVRDPLLRKQRYEETPDDDADTDQETDRLLGQNRTEDDYGFYDDKEWKKVKSRSILPSMSKGVVSSFKSAVSAPAQAAQLLNSSSTSNVASSSSNSANHSFSQKSLVSPSRLPPSNQFKDSSSSVVPIIPNSTSSSCNTLVSSKSKKEKDGVKKKRSKEDLMNNPSVLIEGVLFRARYLGSTQLVCEGQPTKATRMMQAEEAVSRIKAQANQNGSVCQLSSSPPSIETNKGLKALSPYRVKSDGSGSCGGDCVYPSEVVGRGDTGREEDDEGESDEDSVEENDYYRQQRNPVAAALGGTIVDNNIMSLDTENSAGANGGIGVGRCLSSSELTSGVPSFSSMPGSGNNLGSSLPHLSPPCGSALPGTMFRLRFVGSLEVEEEIGSGRRRRKRPKKTMVEEAVLKLKAPEGETQPSTEVDLFISTEKIMVLNTDLKEIMMDHALRTISYIADIGDLVVLMARRRPVPTDTVDESKIPRPPKMICHVFESDEAQYIAQSIGQAFQVAYMEFLKANGIEDHSFVREMDYQEVLNSQEIFGDELQMFAKKELQKEVVVPKTKGEILGVVIVESGWGSMLPTVVIANLAPAGAAARCGQLNIGDQIIAINGVSLVGLPLSTCQNYIKNAKTQTVVKLTVVPCPPVVEVKIKRPDTKYQLGFSVQNGVICSLLRGGIAERGGVRVGHRIIEINNQSVVAVPHEKIVNLLATSVGEINMKTMPTSMFRLLTGQETPLYI